MADVTQVCGTQALHPSLCATTTRTASSDSRKPTDAIGGAWNQSPVWGMIQLRAWPCPCRWKCSKAYWSSDWLKQDHPRLSECNIIIIIIV